MTDDRTEERRPMYAECMDCSHVWAAAYIPMPLAVIAKVLHDVHCPSCGADAGDIVVYEGGRHPSEERA